MKPDSMDLRTLLKADVLLPALAGLGLLAAVGSALLPRLDHYGGPPIRGQTLHDFGEVELRQSAHQLSHTFALQNMSDSPVSIKRMTTTCGCTDVALDRNTVAPGDSLAVSCVLHLSDSGEKTAQIILVTDLQEQPTIRLTLHARGKRLQQLSALKRYLVLRPGEPASLVIIAVNYLDDKAPPEPDRTVPAGVSASFRRWSPIQKRALPRDMPARWEGSLIIEVVDAAALPRSPLLPIQVSLPGGPPLEVTLRVQRAD